jgi:hypothetical protein
MAEITVSAGEDGSAYVDLAAGTGGEIRDSVGLDALEEADQIPALDSIVLHFDHYGRLAALEVTSAAGSVLPPALLDAAES